MQNPRALKKVFLLAILLPFGLMSLAHPVEAGDVKIRVITPDAPLRLEAKVTSPVVSKIPLGSVLTAETKSGEWYRVNLPPDKSGYVISGFIHQGDVLVLEGGTGEAPAEAGREEFGKTIALRIIAQDAEIREGPDAQSRLMGQAPLGTVLESEEKYGTWYKVAVAANVYGFIHQDQLEPLAQPKHQEPPREQVQEKREQAQKSPPVPRADTAKYPRFSLRLTVGGGVGFESIETGASYKIMNDQYEPVTLHPGGGVNLGVDFGYLITRNLKLELGLGYQSSGVIAGGEQVTFSRVPLSLTLSYELPSQRSYNIYFGGGAGLYNAPEVKYDVDNVNFNITYGSSFGIHGLVGFIKKSKSRKLFYFGEIRYVGVFNYKWKTATFYNFQDILYSSSPYAKFGANGIFLNFGLGFYF
ncbi:MAG: SH3 domain-containing protein [Candidatus Aminicenantales bacterium]